MKEIINTEKAPQPIGPYSQAIHASGDFVFISGQIPFKADGTLAGDDIVSQTKQSIENIGAILAEMGLDYNNVVKTTVLMINLADFGTMNDIYNTYFGESKPARAAYQVSKLPKDVLIEIEAVAVTNV
jgi:2-iminobutanoate/2-iminopropanoate deaminase